MSLYNRDEAFICALKKNPPQRNEKDLQVIFSRLHRFEALSNMREQSLRTLCRAVRYEWHDSNEILYGKDDPCSCWFILLSGSIFIQGSMFLRNTSFGKQIPGTKRRGSQCLVLEPSEMIAIDYPDMHPPLHTGAVSVVHVSNLRHTSSTTSRSTLGSVAEVDSSSAESSPSQGGSRRSSRKIANGQAPTMQADSSDLNRHAKEYFQNQEDATSHEDPEHEDQQSDMEEEQEDSISLHSSSSLIIKDLVTDVLKKEPSERNEDDHDVLLEFTRSLQSFSNMTEPIRRELCKVMVFAQVEKASTELLKDKELLDSWSVIINGQVQIQLPDGEISNLYMGESFGVIPSLQPQYHKGSMYTMTDDCQFLCVAQQQYCKVLDQGKENMENVFGEDGKVRMVKEKREIEGGKKGHIVIRGTPDSLREHLLEENSIDTTYAEDYLLTYRAFSNTPVEICTRLLEWFDREEFKAKVTRVFLLWVNNHFNDFECDREMMELLEKFEEKLQNCKKTGECRLFNIACSTKAKARVITLSRSSNEEELSFSITGGTEGYPIYILRVTPNSDSDEKGLKRGDQLLNVNGQNFEKLNMEKANTILRKNTDLTLTVKTNLFAFKEMMSDLKNPSKKKEKSKKGKFDDGQVIAQISTLQTSRPSRMPSLASEADAFDGKNKKGGTLGRAMNKMNKVRTKMFQTKKDLSFKEYMDQHQGMISENDAVVKDDSFLSSLKQGAPKWLPGSAATVDGPRSFKHAAAHSSSNPDLLDPGVFTGDAPSFTEVPEDVIKVFRADQSYRFVFVNQDTTAEEAVRCACKEFGIVENMKNYSLCRVSVQNESFVKQSKLPDKLSNLTEIPLSARYYLKNNMESEQLLPDENIPELLKEANYTFLDLNCFEVALHLTLQDYELFKTVEQTDFIDDLFHLNERNLDKFKEFEDLVNRELFWVVSTMCLEPNVLRRSKMIKHFTKIAHHCKALKNLNSTFAIISGLGYRAVSRMKLTWEKVPAKCQRTFEDLQALMNPSRNMSKYRTLLNDLTAQPPVIPYIPVVKKDLTFLHLGNDTTVESLVNFEKMRMIGREVRNVCRLCSAESSQIISSAIANHHESDRPSSNIYHTLTRRGRRSSFNNARKMYEDAVNARRVKQYMQQLKIESDEDKLMELSKQVEAQVPNSSQPKRRNTTVMASESPSRSSKTLPGGPNALKNNIHARNNSEPQLSMTGTNLSLAPTRKKNPMSSFPKFGTTSPQAIRKLLALSEESGDGGPSGSSKPVALEPKRTGSTSSHELSPAASPYLSPKRDMVRSKGSVSSIESGQSVGHENTNRNNNRGRRDFSPSMSRSIIHSKHLSHPLPSNNSNSSSSRSSIASSSSLGFSSSSLNAPPLSSSSSSQSLSPRSSPNQVAGARDHYYPYHGNSLHIAMLRNSPVRSSSSSSADTVKSFGGRQSADRPVIMQGRSGSFGALSVTTVSSERRVPRGSEERRLMGSSSSPSLVARAASSHHHLILPNHPQIPRSPSMDSGVVSIGSSSADSTRFLNAESADIFQRPAHQSNASLASTEGYSSQISLLQQQGSSTQALNHNSPVMRRHLQNINKQEKVAKSSTRASESTTQTVMPPNSMPPQGAMSPRTTQSTCDPVGGQGGNHEEKEDDIKQTFLSGSRGWGDAPLKRDKDPWPIAAQLPPGSPMTCANQAGWPSSAPGDNVAAICDVRTHPPGNQMQPEHRVTGYHAHTHSSSLKSGEFKGGGDVVDGYEGVQKRTVISGTGPEIQLYYERLRSQERPNLPASLNFGIGPPRAQDAKTPEAMLEERLLMELQQQKPRLNKSFDSASQMANGHVKCHSHPTPLCDRHSVSYSGMPGSRNPGTPDGPGNASMPGMPGMHQWDTMGKPDPRGRHYPKNQPVSVDYPTYPYPDQFCNKPGCKCPASLAAHAQATRYADYNHPGTPQQFSFIPPNRTSSPKQSTPHAETRGPLSLGTEPDNVFISDFGKPNPRTFVRSSVLQENRDKYAPVEDFQSPGPAPSMSYHCPKHGSPMIQQHAGNRFSQMQGQPHLVNMVQVGPHYQSMTQSRAGHPDVPYFRGDSHAVYGHPFPPQAGEMQGGFVHSRSASDVSSNSEINHSDSEGYGGSMNALNNSQYIGFTNNGGNYPSPIDGYVNSPQGRSPYFRETPNNTSLPFGSNRHSLGNVSSGGAKQQHSSPNIQSPRRKSNEWGVTDLDKENQKQAMQVWTSNSSSALNTTANSSGSSNAKEEASTNSPATEDSLQLTTTPKRKKPPPLPPQRNSSYGVTRQLRLSSGTLSPLSSPPNSPTAPVCLSKLSLNETHPQLMVKTKGDALVPPAPQMQPAVGQRQSKPLTQSNGILPNMGNNSLLRKDPHYPFQDSQVPLAGRTLPTYNQAMNHLSTQNKSFSPSSISQLPSYQTYHDTRENKEQISQV